MKTINRNGLKYEIVNDVTQPFVARVPAVLLTDGTEISPEIPEIAKIVSDVETGRVVGIEMPIASQTSISIPHTRTVELLSLVEEIDLEMILQCRINFYTEDGTQLMIDAIDADNSLSSDAKNLKKQMFQSYVLAPKSTRGSYVNPETGALLPADDTSGVREIMFYQNLTKEMLITMGLPLMTESREQFIRYQMVAFMLSSTAQRVGI